MKLQEKNFMLEKIEMEYKVRMGRFCLSFLISISTVPIMISFHNPAQFIDFLTILIVLGSFITSFLYLLILFFEKCTPWRIKTEQIKALNDFDESGKDFEEIKEVEILEEYFE